MSLYYDLLPGDHLIGIIGSNFTGKPTKEWIDEYVEHFTVLERSSQHLYSSLGITNVTVYFGRVGSVLKQSEGIFLTLWFPTKEEEERAKSRPRGV